MAGSAVAYPGLLRAAAAPSRRRLALGVLCVLLAEALLVVVVTVVATVATGPLDVRPVARLLTANVALALLVPLCALVVRVVHRVRPGWLASVRGALRWRWLVACAGVCAVVAVVAVAVSALLPQSSGWGVRFGAGTVLVVVVTSPLQAAGEEWFFRGYLMQAVGAAVRSRVAPVLVTAVAFAAAHGVQDAALFVDRLGFGLVAGALAVRTGGLEAPVALHAVTNVAALMLAASAGGLAHALSLTRVSAWVAGVDLVVYALTAVALAWLAARVRVQRHAGARELAAG